ncbi:uncharacterized protein LOC111052000 isoform X2 [Nilaparvata lugens]|uniref:uncharacterized protein LOC111052000 isoform X2 n=1 Tax=Nilaparvata lugens TaxID=108931 RepID=UPI00193DFB4F|nr:uncharacterized protein LOC111052000 isoform X2 [Nilaparvata lugens]
MSLRNSKCNGCGCTCKQCTEPSALHLHVEIENLKQRLLERENHIVSMETNFLREAEKFPNGEMAALTDELLTWQDKYSRLYEAHKRVQKVNQNLEDKLLRIVDKCETEKTALTTEVASLTRRLVDEKFNVARLQEENERYRNDVNLAIQLLQCKPSNFVPQRYDSLPSDMQQKVKNYVYSKNRRVSDGNGNMQKPEVKTIKVPIPTFPPTAMVYSVNRQISDKDVNGEDKSKSQGSVDIVSAAIMAKVLEERERERQQQKHCDSCTCLVAAGAARHHKASQTVAPPPTDSAHLAQMRNGAPSTNNASSPMAIKSKYPADKSKVSDFSALASERVSNWCDKDNVKKVHDFSNTNLIGFNDLWSKTSVTENSTKTDKVREGILVNIDSGIESSDSSVNKCNEDRFTSANQKLEVGSDVQDVDKGVGHHPPPSFTGARHCSVRLQAGTSNILLDNVVDPYTPVLYKSRPLSDPPVVHPPSRSRSTSSNSSIDESTNMLINKRTIAQIRTETEI